MIHGSIKNYNYYEYYDFQKTTRVFEWNIFSMKIIKTLFIANNARYRH